MGGDGRYRIPNQVLDQDRALEYAKNFRLGRCRRILKLSLGNWMIWLGGLDSIEEQIRNPTKNGKS